MQFLDIISHKWRMSLFTPKLLCLVILSATSKNAWSSIDHQNTSIQKDENKQLKETALNRILFFESV